MFQDRALAVQQSIVRNIFMGRELAGRLGFLDVDREVREAGRLMREIGFTSKVFTPHSIVGQLSGGERQGVAIARAIYKKADLIVLDEPTTALSLTETAKVFHFVRQVRASGRSILFIGHNIHHVFDIADRFVVLDRGRVALETPKAEFASAEKLIGFMEHLAHPDGLSALRPGAPHNERERRRRPSPRKTGRHPHDAAAPALHLNNRAALGSLAVFVVMMLIFLIANPRSSPTGRSTARC